MPDSRSHAVDSVEQHLSSGQLLADLRRRVAYRTVSSEPECLPQLHAYLADEIAPALGRLGCAVEIVENPVRGAGPVLLARRHEDAALPTVLVYGHADVVAVEEDAWESGLPPWEVTSRGGRWYGRGTADNKGQHSINVAAIAHVLAARRGRLGFNLKVLVETGEEVGSPGLEEICVARREDLSADVLIASDGVRCAAGRPTIFLGSRGEANFVLRARLRDASYHSGNWGGVLRNPATVLASAIDALVDGRGRIRPERLRPPPLDAEVRALLADVTIDAGPAAPRPDEGWGEPGLTATERVLAWNSLEVLSLQAGPPGVPPNAIPGEASAHCQLRFVVGTAMSEVEATVRSTLDRAGLSMVGIEMGPCTPATRLEPGDPWVGWARRSMRETTGSEPAVLPNLGGTLPNHVFSEILGLPTIWIPHSYPACGQHAANEHLPVSLALDALRIMTGVFWDLGEAISRI
ncbi:MAG: M20 family metallopeptidase [Nocardioidaceae bacterium]|nr:M20 family metallopeptidase [Nocardioidaceae bacterium]